MGKDNSEKINSLEKDNKHFISKIKFIRNIYISNYDSYYISKYIHYKFI